LLEKAQKFMTEQDLVSEQDLVNQVWLKCYNQTVYVKSAVIAKLRRNANKVKPIHTASPGMAAEGVN
jgi:hypothetical protein